MTAIREYGGGSGPAGLRLALVSSARPIRIKSPVYPLNP